MRKKIVAGNWKMNATVADAGRLVETLKRSLAKLVGVDVVLCPPFTALQAVSRLLDGTSMELGAQNLHWEKPGAFTGEISAEMLKELFCHYAIVGHSERRALFHETDEGVNRKVKTALAHRLRPILCVGETLQERQADRMREVVRRQVVEGLKDIAHDSLPGIVIAYEPVWAIGTGVTATPAQAQEAHAFIRKLLAELANEKTAQAVRIQYGGSVKAGNAKELFQQPDIDGGLIGGASLDAEAFTAIVNAAL